jgi:hypothetical protein
MPSVGTSEESGAVLALAAGLKLYPNPVLGGSFTIASEAALSKVRILTLTGVSVYDLEVSGYSAELRTVLPAGAYVVEITTDSGTQRKLVRWE